MLKACKSKDLTDGQSCMNETEAGAYFQKLGLNVLGINNFIDYEDIENPVKTSQKVRETIRVDPRKYIIRRYDYQRHTFIDNTSRL